MEGDLTPTSLGTFSPNAGVIPRSLHRLFQMLEDQQSEYAVRVSYLELYNEQLRDLNAASSFPPGEEPIAAALPPRSGRASVQPGVRPTEPAGPIELKMYDDAARRGVVVHGLEETLITTAEEGIRVLTRGSQRRQIAGASTRCCAGLKLQRLGATTNRVDRTPSSPSPSTFARPSRSAAAARTCSGRPSSTSSTSPARNRSAGAVRATAELERRA